MTVAGDEAGEARVPANQASPILHQRAEPPAQLLAFDGLALHQRDRLGIVGHARHRKPEVGFVALLLEIERDERTADEVRDQRADRRIAERDPDQVTGNREIDAEQRQGRRRGNAPEDVGKRSERDDAVEQRGAELERALDEEIDIVADTQVDVVDALIDELQAIVTALRHPEADVPRGDPLPPSDGQRLDEEVRRGAGGDGAAQDETKDQQFGTQHVPAPLLQRVEEAGIPVDGQNRDGNQAELRRDHAAQQQAGLPAFLRSEIGKRKLKKRAQAQNHAGHTKHSIKGVDALSSATPPDGQRQPAIIPLATSGGKSSGRFHTGANGRMRCSSCCCGAALAAAQ